MDALASEDAEIRVMRQELQSIAVHWHDFYELVYVVDGSAEHVVNGVAEPVRPGSVFLLTPTDFHALQAIGDRPLTCYNVVIDVRVADRLLDEVLPGARGWPPCAVDGWADARSDFERLWRESQSAEPGAVALIESVVACALIELGRSWQGQKGFVPEPLSDVAADLRRAVMFVDRNFREPLALADVAAQAHLSPNYFSERFRQATGSSFQAYLQARRLRFARSLLASTDLGVTEVCHAAGFQSPSHFGRAYRRRYGEPPSACRSEITSQRGVTAARRGRGRAVA
ncbi:MAG TPA: AraC family transcriptional regulator [Nocardioidaceae bacterium]|nr:AraC family transcriptional regulator [Nocardioidaceae bacterium]